MQFDRIIALRNDRTIFRNGDKCIKVFNPDYPMALALKEALNCTLAGTAGIPVPKVFEVTRVDNSPAIVFEYISGKTFELLCAANPESAPRLLKVFIDVQSKIHHADCPGLSDILPSVQTFSTSCLCHCDFDFSNIVLSASGQPYVLDWENAACGDPALDKAITYSLLLESVSPEIAEDYLASVCHNNGEAIKNLIPLAAALRSKKRC